MVKWGVGGGGTVRRWCPPAIPALESTPAGRRRSRGFDRAGAAEGDLVVVRDGLSLLVRRGDVLVRVRPRSAEPVTGA